MKSRILFLTALLALGLSAASFAATPAPAAATGGHEGRRVDRCEAKAQECKEAAAKFDQWCSANAEKCTALKAWAEKRREYCEANAKKCAEHREKMREHMHAMKTNQANGQNGDQPDEDQAPPPPSV